MNRQRGVSIIELLAGIIVLALCSAIALPSLSEWLARNRQTYAVNQMLGALNYSREVAIFKRKVIVLCGGAAACNGSERWSDRVVIFQDNNANGLTEAGESVLRHIQLPEGYEWRWASFRKLHYAAFEQDSSTRAANGTLTLCHQGLARHQIVINLLGRIRHQAPLADAPCQ